MSFKIETELLEDHEARPSFIAQMTGISPKTLGKAVEAGFIGRLTHQTTLDVASLPLLTRVSTPSGVPIPFLRMGVKGESIGGDGPHNPPRKWAGLGADMTDKEVSEATLRWWKTSGRQRVLDAGYLLVAIGGITVGLLAIEGWEWGTGDKDDRIEYIGTLVARVDDVLSREIRIVDESVDQDVRDFAQQVLATRSTTRGGGVINLLDADIDAEREADA